MSFLTQPITLQSLFGKDRTIGDISVNVILSESTNDALTITKQPVQTGASITDHAYLEPTTLSMQILQQDNEFSFAGLLPSGAASGLAALYKKFLKLQSDRVPFAVFTPKRLYKNMLLSGIALTTDKKTENILALSLSFQEVIIVAVATTSVPRSRQRLAPSTQATQNAGQKSIAKKIANAVTGQ